MRAAGTPGSLPRLGGPVPGGARGAAPAFPRAGRRPRPAAPQPLSPRSALTPRAPGPAAALTSIAGRSPRAGTALSHAGELRPGPPADAVGNFQQAAATTAPGIPRRGGERCRPGAVVPCGRSSAGRLRGLRLGPGESRRHRGWKRPLGAWSDARLVSQPGALSATSRDGHPQGWGLHRLSGQRLPMFNNLFHSEILPNIQPEPPLA